MRKFLFVSLMVLLSVAWVAAQQQNAPGGSMPGHETEHPGGRAVGPQGQDTNPPTAMPPADSDKTQVIEGCLGGGAPEFTVTDKGGTVYNLDIPKDADTSPLTAHIGQSVRVKGTVNGTGTSGSSDKNAGAKSQTIQVEQMSRGTGNCPGGASQPPATK